jgi:hypothetical protein
MRLTAYHDANGNIVGMAVSPSENLVPAEVISNTQPGLRMTNVETPSEETLNFENPEQLNEKLRKLVENYQIDAGVLKRKS